MAGIDAESRGATPVTVWALRVIAAYAVFILSTDLHIAALPRMAAALPAGPGAAQLTVTLNLAAYAAATLAMGPLADRFGRARMLRLGLVGFLLASALCWAAPSIGALIAGRIGQGLSASAGGVLTAVVLRELFDDAGAQRWMAVMALATATGPALGPLAGAALAEAAGWRAPFAALCALSALALAALFRMPETGARGRAPLSVGGVAEGFRAVLRNPRYMRPQLVNGFALGALFAFLTAGPFVFIETFGLTPLGYAATHGGLVLLYIGATGLSARLAGRLRPERLLDAGVAIGFAGLLVLGVGATRGGGSLGGVAAGMALNAVSIGLIIANAWPMMMKAVPAERVGAAAALAGFAQMALGAMASLVAAALPSGSPGGMALAITLFAGASGLAHLWPAGPARATAP